MAKKRVSKKSIDNLIPFQKGISGNPKGRPKKFITSMKDEGYKLHEINDTLQVLLSMRKSELISLIKEQEATILEVMVAKALITSFNDGDMRSMETILSRVFGHPKASLEHSVKEQPLFPEDNPDGSE